MAVSSQEFLKKLSELGQKPGFRSRLENLDKALSSQINFPGHKESNQNQKLIAVSSHNFSKNRSEEHEI